MTTHRIHRRRGQSLTEYLALVGLLVIAAVASMELLGKQYDAGFKSTSAKVGEWFK